MGLYDFFKGVCPSCGNDIDNMPEFGKCGDIQTKFFSPNEDNCFREFYPRTHVPFAPEQDEMIIGKTACCNTTIKACFQGSLLTGYRVA